MKTKIQTKKIVMASMLAALVAVATMAIKIPSPLHGYLNLGDAFVLLSGWVLSPVYGFLAAGLGSAIADLILGYVVYAPATFVIKGIMALVVFLSYKAFSGKIGKLSSRIIGGLAAEIIMTLGYFVFEGFLYGFGPSVVNIPANAVQGIAGLIIGVILMKIVEKAKIIK